MSADLKSNDQKSIDTDTHPNNLAHNHSVIVRRKQETEAPADDIHTEKLMALQKEILSGNYQISAEKISEKIIDYEVNGVLAYIAKSK